MTTRAVVDDYIRRWMMHHPVNIDRANRYCRLADDLYKVRNPGFNGSPPINTWPSFLIHSDDEVMACVEHYFLTRCWVGTGKYPAWQLRGMRDIYNIGKRLGLTPRHNPNNPVTRASDLQQSYQDLGIRHGEEDLIVSGRTPPIVGTPPTYW
jgi:hypothetical protein